MEARFYERIDGKRVMCKACRRKCVIEPGSSGFCRVRRNEGGKLVAINLGKLVAAALDPIEKKPFYHFHPGEKTFSISSFGCNFRCVFCCNYDISQEWEDVKKYAVEFDCEELVERAERSARIITFTYSEPTVWIEDVEEIAKIAKKRGLLTTMVTNGYFSEEVCESLVKKYIDAVVIDVKNSLSREAYKRLSSVANPEVILENVEALCKKIWVEVTNLIVKDYGEKIEDVKNFLKKLLDVAGDEIPLHFLRYYPSYKLHLPPTSLEFLARCYETAREMGFKYVI